MKKEYVEKNPLTVLESVYAVIVDRMKNPKEDSYTNAVMEKGIDEILKKLGHECTEIILAAKNPDSDDLKFEISDFMYHCMILMAQKYHMGRDSRGAGTAIALKHNNYLEEII